MVTIKRALPGDFDLIMPLAFALQEYEASIDEAVRVTPKTKNDLVKFERKNIKRRDARFFIALDGEKVVGYISGWLSKANISVSGKSYGFICDCFVLEKYRGCGVGRLLNAELLKWFRAKEVEYIEVYTYVNNAVGKGFWESEGFRPNMVRYLKKMDG
ncbi:MAG: GNAT family N-acetyltransferase [Methanobacteriota archaeon]